MNVDEFWSAVLETFRELAPVEVGRSRFGPKPAITLSGREIAHWEAPGVIDLRVTAAGWSEVRATFGDDPAVTYEQTRRDWIEVRAMSADVDRLRPLLAATVAHNAA